MSDLVIIKKNSLPSYIAKIIEAKNLINNHHLSISQACKQLNLSRSTFYKYKDSIYDIHDYHRGRKAQFSLLIENITGSLNKVINILNQNQANIITINQSIPLNDTASIQFTIDISKMPISIEDLTQQLSNLTITKSVKLISIE